MDHDHHNCNVSCGKADMVTILGQDVSDMSSCTGNRPNASAVEDVIGTAAENTLAAACPFAQGGTVCMDAGNTLAAGPLDRNLL